MTWLDADQLQAAGACLVACVALGWFVPFAIARIPEPEPVAATQSEPESPAEDVADSGERRLFSRTLPPAPQKETYAAIGALPGLRIWTAAWSGLVGAAFGASLGWTGALLYLVPFVPIGVALLVVDWRTTLLPNRIIFPTYALLVVLLPVAALVDHDLHSLYRAGWGWLVIGGWFWLFWFLLNGWGYGDVRLAGLLGPALGYLGWYQLLMGLALIVMIGGIGGLVIGIALRDLRRRVPYGPFMLVGAALAVIIGPWLARSLGY